MQVDELLKPFPDQGIPPVPQGDAGPGCSRDDRAGGEEAGIQEDPGDDHRPARQRHRPQDRRVAEVPRPRRRGLRQGRVQSQGLQRDGRRGALPGEQVRLLRLDRRRLPTMRARAPGSRWRTTAAASTSSRASTSRRTRRTRRTSPSPPRRAPARRPPGRTSSPTPRPTRISRTSTSRSTTPAWPRLAIDDPVLHYDCPLDYTAQCGFDVLAHASEPYVSRLNFPPSLGNALYAIKLTAENLRAAVWNGQDLPGREGMMYAQYIAAQAFNSGGLGIIHSISHAVSAFYDTPPRPEQRDRAAAGLGVQHAGGLPAVRRHRPRRWAWTRTA